MEGRGDDPRKLGAQFFNETTEVQKSGPIVLVTPRPPLNLSSPLLLPQGSRSFRPSRGLRPGNPIVRRETKRRHNRAQQRPHCSERRKQAKPGRSMASQWTLGRINVGVPAYECESTLVCGGTAESDRLSSTV